MVAHLPGDIVVAKSFAGKRLHGSYDHREVAMVVACSQSTADNAAVLVVVTADGLAHVSEHYVVLPSALGGPP